MSAPNTPKAHRSRCSASLTHPRSPCPRSNSWSFKDIVSFRIDLGPTRDRVVIWLLLKGSLIPPRTRTRLEIHLQSETEAQELATRLGVV